MLPIVVILAVWYFSRENKGERAFEAEVPREVADTVPEPTSKEKTKIPAESMVYVKGGCFEMGDNFGDGNKNEKPVHRVCIDDFFMDTHEVVQMDFEAVMGSNPSDIKDCPNCPVERVTWSEARKYCRKVGMRLPTEAEWEYAARSGGKKEKYAGTSNESELQKYSWYGDGSGKTTHPVGGKLPNELGLYDMSGNVWEWVNDWFDNHYYTYSPVKNPEGAETGKTRVLRGGSWYFLPKDVRVSYRLGAEPDMLDALYGFRCVR